MNDNTVLRIKVPAHLYESVKKQLTLKESKKKLSEAISGTEEELMDFYQKVKQIEAEGTDLESAIQYALFDMNNPDAAKELSSPMNEAAKGKAHYGAGMEVVKEKKLPKKGMEKVEEDKGYMGTKYDSSEDMATSMIKKEAKKGRSLEELMKAKEKLEKKINEMKGADKKAQVEENINEASGGLELVQQIIADPKNAYDLLKTAASMAPHEFDVLLAGLGTIATFLGGGIGLTIKNAVQKAKAEKGQA